MTKNFLPEILLLTYIMAALITPKARSFSISWIFAAAILACFSEEESTKSTFFYQKHSIMLLKIMPLFSGIMISHLMKSEEFEKQLLLMGTILGALLAVSAKNFISLFLSLQLMIIPTYWLLNRNDSAEGKSYFLFSILRLASFAAATAIIYFSVGSTSFNDVRYWISFSYNHSFVWLELLLFLLAFPIKFNFLPERSLAFRIIQKKISMAALVYCVIYPIVSIVFYRTITNIFLHIDTRNIFLLLGLSMVLLFSSQLLFQNNLKKIVGCTIMNYVGNTLLCCAFPCYNSASSIMFSSASAVASLLGIFFLLDGVKKSKVQQIENISHLNSLAYSNPLFATSVSLLFLSLFGFPPFLGFWGKFYVCSAMIGKNWTLAIYAATLISNLICIAKILDAIWFRKNKETFIFAENTVESVNLMAFLMIIAIPAVCKILQLMNAELYFA